MKTKYSVGKQAFIIAIIFIAGWIAGSCFAFAVVKESLSVKHIVMTMEGK